MKRLIARAGLVFLSLGFLRLPVVAGASASASPFETVNALPQLTVQGRDGFFFYWGLWRTLTSAERARLTHRRSLDLTRFLGEPGTIGRIYSHRNIRWSTSTCEGSERVDEGSEELWFLDELILDADGRLEPVAEASRSDYRYFSLLNLRGVKLAGAQGTSLRGMRGQVRLSSRFLLWALSDAPQDRGFLSLRQFRESPDLRNQRFFEQANPGRWPIFYDERAHKPHSLDAPVDLQERLSAALSEDHFEMTLDWSSCSGEQVQIEAGVPAEGIPPPGPNRPGRDDQGAEKIQPRTRKE